MLSYSESYDTAVHRKRIASLHALQRRFGARSLLRAFGHAHWVPEGLRFRAIECLYGAEYSGSEPFEIDFFGLSYRGNLNSFLDWWVYFFGAYEERSLFFLRDILLGRADPVFLDVGANVGVFSLFLSRFASHVHSFEPWGTVRESMREKVEVNRIANVTIHPVALGDKDGRLPFYAPRGANMGTGSFNSDHAADRNLLLGKLEVVNGDSYLSAHGISGVDVIKIDVEGWEGNVLLGLQDTLARCGPLVFLEVSDTTLRVAAGIGGLRMCMPANYEASYVEFGRAGAEFSPFDGARPGDVLLWVRGRHDLEGSHFGW